MAQFDVYRVPGGYALDCQSNILRHYDSRFTVPLRTPDQAPLAAQRLNPTFAVEGQSVVMVTQFAGAVPVKVLKEKVGTLAGHEYEIKAALDMLISGF